MKSEEGYIDVPGGKVWYRAVADTAEAPPLLCLHGGPGFTHYYLEPLEALADRRRVIFYDQLGCGRSDRPDDLSLWNVDRFVPELAQVRSALNLDRLHLFGSSWGGMLAMQYVLDRQGDQPELESLILCGSPASMIRWVSDCTELLAEETEETRRVIREHEAAGFTSCPEYQAAILGFYRKHVCRLDPWPPGPRPPPGQPRRQADETTPCLPPAMWRWAVAAASSSPFPAWRASMYAAYQPHQSCGGATASNEPWWKAVSFSSAARAATSAG